MKRYISCFVLGICLVFQPGVSFTDEGDSVEISVVQKDSLINFSRKYLEHPEQWRSIARINNLADPDLILPGQTLKVPVEMLKGTSVDGVVSFLKGNVRVYPIGAASWQELQLKNVIKVGSAIKTSRESSAEISFADGTTLFIKPNTTLNLHTSKMTPSTVISRIELLAGRLYSKIKSATARKSRFEIKTPYSTASARGTEFRASIDDRQTTRVEVLDGVVDVAAMGRKVEVNGGEGTVAMMNAAPGQPARLLPPPEMIGVKSLYRAAPFSVRFGKTDGAASYRVLLTKDKAARDIIQEKVIGPEEKFEVIDIADGTYFLTSSSIDANGLEGVEAAPVEIRVKIPPVPAAIQVRITPPTPSTPIAGSAETASNAKQVEFTWLELERASGYHLQIAQDREFSKITHEVNNFKGQSYKMDNLPPGRYYCRLQALEEDGFAGEWTAVQAFTISAPPATPQLDKPNVEGKDLNFTWSRVAGGVTFQVQVARDEEFKQVIIDRVVDQTEITLKELQDDGKYYLRVRSIDNNSLASNFSNPQNFTIKTRFPMELIGALGVALLLIF